jgi:small subunit ribosomal protein S29
LSNTDGVPTLGTLSSLALPPPPPAHPALGNPKPYVKHRKHAIFDSIYAKVEKIAEPKMEKILAMDDWDAKQKAIDELFEHVHDELKNSDKDGDDYIHVVLGSQPNFPILVEKALEKYLRNVVRNEKVSFQEGGNAGTEGEKHSDGESGDLDEYAIPVFMDLMKANDPSLDDKGIPKLLYPLSPHRKDGPGRMVEEWELAANTKTKRIMIRQCPRDIAKALDEKNGSRVFVTGRKGAGKTAALAAIVASARESGHIVLYLPDGDRLRKHGFYVEVNNQDKEAKEKIFDIPMLSKEICNQLWESHSKDMNGITVSKDRLEKFMAKEQLKKLYNIMQPTNDDGSMFIGDVLKIGGDNLALSAGCYGAAIDTLITQTLKPFTIVMDQFNCYYDYGHYFHGEYDKLVQNPIPLDKITLFQPLIHAMGVTKSDNHVFSTIEPKSINYGGIVVGITESHAVAKRFTKDLTVTMKESGAKVVEVPQYSAIEVDHILANFEITGIGRLRFDRGETVMDKNEVAFLRMVSGGIGQSLLDACVQ